MMTSKWLVTIAADKVAEAAEHIRHLGCSVAPEAAVSVDHDTVVPVSGPEHAQEKVRRVPGVKAVHPDSDLTLY
jgi:hypothetical protein